MYRMRPLVVEAVQWNGLNGRPRYRDVYHFVAERVSLGQPDCGVPLLRLSDDSLQVWVDQSDARCLLGPGD
jgi:hypothetical protein